jgi:hypothetical protein
MTIEFRCDKCAKMLRAHEEQEGKDAPCPACGTLTVVPSPETARKAAPAPRRVEVAQETLRLADEDEEEGRPSRAPAERTCPGCDAPMERGAVLCLACGFDRRIGKRRKTKVKRYERDWAPPPTLASRIVGLALAVPAFGFVCFLLLLAGVHPVPLVLFLLAFTSLALLAAGWYHTLHLARDRDGTLLLTKRSYLCFAPVGTVTIDLAECEAVQIDAGDPGTGGVAPGWHEMMGTIFLILMFGWIGAMIARNTTVGHGSSRVRFAIRLLSRRKRKPVLTLYRGSNEDFMRDLVDTLKEEAELEIVR